MMRWRWATNWCWIRSKPFILSSFLAFFTREIGPTERKAQPESPWHISPHQPSPRHGQSSSHGPWATGCWKREREFWETETARGDSSPMETARLGFRRSAAGRANMRGGDPLLIRLEGARRWTTDHRRRWRHEVIPDPMLLMSISGVTFFYTPGNSVRGSYFARICIFGIFSRLHVYITKVLIVNWDRLKCWCIAALCCKYLHSYCWLQIVHYASTCTSNLFSVLQQHGG